MPLHLNINNLLSARTVESERIEYKGSWNPDAIYRTICAFANDVEHTGGGYILIGVEEDPVSRTVQRPVKGLTTAELSVIQEKMIGMNNLIHPVYHPHLSIEPVDGKQIIVLWVPEYVTARDKRYFFWIRKYSSTVKANLEEQQELISMASALPFDDRVNTSAGVRNISLLLVNDHLRKVNSRLAELVNTMPYEELLGQMELVSGPIEKLFPRNVGLMMFSEDPDRFFPCTRVELVEFPEGDAGVLIEHGTIRGPVPEQIARTLNFLRDKLVKEKVIKQPDRAESIRVVSYPIPALEEIVVNAFFHRDYQQREPIEVRIYPNSIIFLNYGGPDRSIRLDSFGQGQTRPRRYRNRRLGEFLKELELTEGRATGIPTILRSLRDNGSPPPRFDTDDGRSYFEVELFIHPEFIAKEPFVPPFGKMLSTLEDVDAVLKGLLEYYSADSNAVIKLIEEDNQAQKLQNIENQVIEMLGVLTSNQVSNLAGGIIDQVSRNELLLLEQALVPRSREILLRHIGLTNQTKNVQLHILPLIDIGWLTRTIPDSPTSPNQRYVTTLKGRLVLKILERYGFDPEVSE